MLVFFEDFNAKKTNLIASYSKILDFKENDTNDAKINRINSLHEKGNLQAEKKKQNDEAKKKRLDIIKASIEDLGPTFPRY